MWKEVKGLKIGDLRKAVGMTQVKLAEILGVSQSTVAQWESGEVMPKTEKLPALAEALGCKIDELFVKGEG